jgi:hypothetical protein
MNTHRTLFGTPESRSASGTYQYQLDLSAIG